MISRQALNITKKILTAQQRVFFGGISQHHKNDGHGHDHGHDSHHGHEVVINKTQNWVSNQDTSLLTLNGFNDINEDSHHHEDADDFAHVRDKPFLSFERWYFMDPHYASDESEPLMNDAHGYLTNDDPFEHRNLYDKSSMEYLTLIMVAMGVGLFLGFNNNHFRQPGDELLERHITAEVLEGRIREIRIQNHELLKRKEQLLQQLNEE